MVPELEKATVRIRQPERVRGIIRALREQGVAKLQEDFGLADKLWRFLKALHSEAV